MLFKTDKRDTDLTIVEAVQQTFSFATGVPLSKQKGGDIHLALLDSMQKRYRTQAASIPNQTYLIIKQLTDLLRNKDHVLGYD